jgi:hypothetical protein
MRKLTFVLVIFMIAAGCRKEKSSVTEDFTSFNFDFIQSGNSWTYATIVYDSAGVSTDTLPGSYVMELRDKTGELYPLYRKYDIPLENEPNKYWTRTTEYWGQTDEAGDPVSILMKRKVVLGDKYTLLEGGETISVEVTALSEKIIAPAGTFNAVRLKLSGRELIRYLYIASGVGIVRGDAFRQGRLVETLFLESRNF